MDDDAFLEAFETHTLPNSAFHHRDHVRLTWLYLRRDGFDLGARHVSDGIRHFAAAHGAADRFHETLTSFWVGLVHHVMQAFPNVATFEQLLAAFPPLADKSIVYRHYSRDLLSSAAARQGRVAPDLRPLP